MPTQLRTRLLASTLTTVALIGALLVLVVMERTDLNRRQQVLLDLKNDVRLARELSLYVQYGAHDTNAYTLGHLEHRDEFTEHAAEFRAVTASLQTHDGDDAGGHDPGAMLVDQIATLRGAYDAASLALFEAADAMRAASSPANQAAQDVAWERADQLGDELDETSQELALHIDDEITEEQSALDARNAQMLVAVGVLGVSLVGLALFIQQSAAAAIGQPLDQLLAAVRRYAAGDPNARAGLRRQDEVGILADAFDDLAERVGRQTRDLQAAYTTSRAALDQAEAAQQALSKQLALIEEQQAVIREMSVPILPLSDHSLVLPLIGALDTARLQLVQAQALAAIERLQAHHLLLDVTGVPVIDTQVALGLIRLVDAARLIGAEVVLVGVRPEVAQSIVGLGLQLERIVTQSTLQSGIALAHARGAGRI